MFLAVICFAGPPVNDSFWDATPIIGSNVTFTVDLNEATSPQYPEPAMGIYATDVWWSFTATNACSIMLLPKAPNGLRIGQWDYWDHYAQLAVYTFEGDQLVTVRRTWVDNFPNRNLTFEPAVGRKYFIQLSDETSGSRIYWLNVEVLNGPKFLVQPLSQTALQGESVLFAAWPIGAERLQFQWQFNTEDIPGETTRMLAIHNVGSSNAGLYRLIATDRLGTNFSESAHLFFKTNLPQPNVRIELRSTNRLEVTVIGDVGRRYLLEVSTNCVDWKIDYARFDPFRASQLCPRIIFTTNGTATCVDMMDSRPKYYRVSAFSPENEVCSLNSRQLTWAKAWWANENFKGVGDTPNLSELCFYFRGLSEPKCPSFSEWGWSYKVGAIGSLVQCISSAFHDIDEAP